MKIALAVIEITGDKKNNLQQVLKSIETASSNAADILFFAETTITGLIKNDDYNGQKKLADTADGPTIAAIKRKCKQNHIYCSVGYLELENYKLYDSAMLINKDGEEILQYKRISPGWHWPDSDKRYFCEGKKIGCVDTEFGRTSIIICGDITGEQGQLDQIKCMSLDFVHVPLCRSYTKRVTQRIFEEEILPFYQKQVRLIGIPTIFVNYKDIDCFGSAFIIDKTGKILFKTIPYEEGIFYYSF